MASWNSRPESVSISIACCINWYVGIQATVRRYTTNVQNARMVQERRTDVERSGINRELAAERLRIANAESEERAARKRIALQAAQKQRDAELEEAAMQVLQNFE